MHLAIYRRLPKTRAVVHCHPPHVTAFSVTGQPVPSGILPEVEVSLGPVQTVDYQTPGTEAFAEAIVPFLERSRILVLQNHGTVSWAATLERALWWTEILESYCRMLFLARQLGAPRPLSAQHLQELTRQREALIDSGEI
jgi:L-fuculose-phosphate aldolase